MMAALYGKDIILSGYHLSNCYTYNGSKFTSLFNLLPSKSKIVCEGWVYSNGILYENHENNASKWSSHNVTAWDTWLWVYSVFQKNKFIYFIDSDSSLMRIDTTLKSINNMPFN